MPGFSWQGFTQGAMEGAMRISDERRKQADEYFKRLDGIYDKTRQEKIKADQQLASATALAKQYGVDVSYAVNAQLQGLQGNDLIEYMQRAKPKAGSTNVADVKVQTDKILGLDTLTGSTNPTESIIQKPTPEQTAVANSPEGQSLRQTIQTTDPTANTVATNPAEATPNLGPTSPIVPSFGKGPETNGDGTLGALSGLLFGPTARQRAMSQFEETYGKDAVNYLNQGGKSAYLEAASKPSAFDVGPKKVDLSKMVDKVSASDFRTKADFERFGQLVSEGKLAEALALPMDFETRKRLETQSQIAASTAAAVAGARAAAQYGPQGVINLINPKTNEAVAVNSRDGASISKLTSQGYVEASNYNVLKEAKLTPVDRVFMSLRPEDFATGDFQKAVHLYQNGQKEEAFSLVLSADKKQEMAIAQKRAEAGIKEENKDIHGLTYYNPKLSSEDDGYTVGVASNDTAKQKELLAKGYLQVPPNFAGKLQDLGKTVEGKVIDTVANINNTIDSVNSIKKIISRNPTAQTYAGPIAIAVSNWTNDVRGIAKLAGIDTDKYIDPSKVDSNLGAWDWAGQDAARLRAAFSNLLYLNAKAAGQSSNSISDRDIVYMADQVGAGLRNPETAFMVLDDLVERTKNQGANYYRAATKKELDDKLIKPYSPGGKPDLKGQVIPGADNKPKEAAKPQPLPTNAGKVDSGQLKKGSIYDIPGKGQYRWDGKQFEQVE